MYMKSVICATLLACSMVAPLQAAGLFPEIVDPHPGYDGLQDNLSFGTVNGIFVRNAAGGAGGSVRNFDTVAGLFTLSQVNGVALPPGQRAAIVTSFDFRTSDSFGGFLGGTTLPSDSITASGRAGYSIDSLFGAGTLSGLGFNPLDVAMTSAVLLTSSTLNFSGASAFTSLTDLTNYLSTNASNFSVEAILKLEAGDLAAGGGGSTAITFGGGFSVQATTFDPVSFLPVDLPGNFNGNTYDFVLGSVGTASTPNTVLGMTGGFPTVAGGVKHLSGTAIGAVNAVPEPGTLLAVLACVGGAGFFRLRRSQI